MQIDIFTTAGKKDNAQDVSATVFDRPFNEALVHQVVTACLSNRRAGTHAQKTRAEVSGGGAKPWNQKGSGRARAGTTRSPLWRHGGVTFAASPTSYAQKINKKMYRAALCVIFSQLLRDDRLKVIDKLSLKQPKTKEILTIINSMKLVKPLIILDEANDNLSLAIRNLPHTSVVMVSAIDPVNLLAHENILITKAALVKLNEVLNNA
jgi:large subunit ribosomal protein L4